MIQAEHFSLGDCWESNHQENVNLRARGHFQLLAWSGSWKGCFEVQDFQDLVRPSADWEYQGPVWSGWDVYGWLSSLEECYWEHRPRHRGFDVGVELFETVVLGGSGQRSYSSQYRVRARLNRSSLGWLFLSKSLARLVKIVRLFEGWW